MKMRRVSGQMMRLIHIEADAGTAVHGDPGCRLGPSRLLLLLMRPWAI